jgi:hypothetical protein
MLSKPLLYPRTREIVIIATIIIERKKRAILLRNAKAIEIPPRKDNNSTAMSIGAS